MAYSATLAHMRGILDDTDYKRILDLFSRAGLSMDHHQFDEAVLDKGTKQILKTRDGKLRAAVPSPLGSCVFLNDVSMNELFAALRRHKEVVKGYPRNGEGLDAFVDASDTGYTMNNKPVEDSMDGSNGAAKKNLVVHDDSANGHANGNGIVNGGPVTDILSKKDALHHASAPEGVDGLQKDGVNGSKINVYVNGYSNGVNGSAH
jgi:3-dehydroquinate synthase